METLETFLPLKDSTIGYCTDSNMADPSHSIDDEEDKICELKIKSSPTIISDRKNHLSGNSADVDNVVVDVQVSAKGLQLEHASTNSLKMVSHKVVCDGKKQEKVNGVVDHCSVPFISENDTKTLPDPESPPLDSSSLSDASPSTSQSSDLLIQAENTPFLSDIESRGSAAAELDLTVASTDTCTPTINGVTCESNGIVSGVEATSVELFEEKEDSDALSPSSPKRSRYSTVMSNQESSSIEMINAEPTSEPISEDISCQVDGMQQHETNAANSTAIASGNDHVENTVAAPGSDNVEGTVAAPGSDDVEGTVAAPGSDDVEGTVAAPGSDDMENTVAEPGSDDVSDTVAAPESDDVSDAVAAPESDDVSGAVAAPESDDISDAVAAPESDDVLGAVAAPESDDVLGAVAAPESDDISDAVAAPESDDISDAVAAPESDAVEDTIAVPESDVVEDTVAAPESDDVEVEGQQSIGMIEDCFTISETDMDCCVIENDAAEEDEAAALNDDEMTTSVQRSDSVSPCTELPNETEPSDSMPSHNSPGHDVLPVDENAPMDDDCPEMAQPPADEDTCEIRIADSRTVAADFSEIICLEESDTEQEIVPNENHVHCKESESVNDVISSVNNCSEQTEQQNSAQSSIDKVNDKIIIENVSGSVDKVTPECNSQKVTLGLDRKEDMPSIDNDQFAVKPTSLQPIDCASNKTTKTQQDKSESVSGLSQTSKDATISTVQRKVSETSPPPCETKKVVAKLNCSEHSKLVAAHHSKHDSQLCKVEKSDNVKVNSVNKKESEDKLGIKDCCVDSKVGNLVKEIQVQAFKEEDKPTSKREPEKTENIDEDDEVLFVDEAGDIKPTDSTRDKKPNSSIILPTPKPECKEVDRIVIDENDCLDSTSLVRETQESAKHEQFVDKQGEEGVEPSIELVLEVDIDEPMEIPSPEDACNSRTPSERGRKRSHVENDAPSASKRSRIEEQLEHESKEKPREAAPEVADSDDDVILEEEAPVAVGVGEVTVSPKDDLTVLLSSEVLQNLISLRVRAFLKSHKQTNLEKLNMRTRGMQSASNLWKETAKHLEKSITNLLALNQKLEKNKKLLESRSVGIQVGGDNQGLFRPVVNGAYNRMPEAGSPSQNSRPPTSTNPHTPQHHQVQSSPANNPALRNPATAPQPPAPRIQNRPGRPVSFSPSSNPAHTPPQRPAMAHPGRMPQNPPFVRPPIRRQSLNNVVNLIDLTDDDDSTRKTITRTPAPQPGTQNISKLPMGGKTTAPGNSNFKPGYMPQGSNGQNLHSPAGAQSQHLTSNKPGSGAPYQLITMSNSAPSQNQAPASRPGPASNTQHTSPGKSNLSTNKRTPQNSPQSLPSSAKTVPHSLPPSFLISNKHPAPLPSGMDAGNAPPSAKRRPPKPGLKISKVSQGIVLSWNMPLLVNVEKIASYQLFAYQESDASIPKSSLWKKVGDVKALPLPMACTLTQFQEGNKYHFAVRAVDQYGRWGSYSDPSSIFLGSKT